MFIIIIAGNLEGKNFCQLPQKTFLQVFIFGELLLQLLQLHLLNFKPQQVALLVWVFK